MKHLFFTVTNDLTYDQRMHRICNSLAAGGYKVTLVGRKKKTSLQLQKHLFIQHRLPCFFEKGLLFYIEYNLRLFLYLISHKMDAVCAVDLDTILPCLLASQLNGTARVYDAHEYFTEMKEVQRRKWVQKVWLAIEKYAIHKFNYCYTVSDGLAAVFNKKYKKNFISIRNIGKLQNVAATERPQDFILYQGAVNEGRGLEYLMPAMQYVTVPLIICGDGNFMQPLKSLISHYNLQDRVILKGMLLPEELKKITPSASLGINLTETEGQHHYYALPNKFFDYIHAGVPQITMNLPEYRKINESFKVAVLIDDLKVETIAGAINDTIKDKSLLNELSQNCLKARKVYNWENEEEKLLQFYNAIWQKGN